MKRQRSRSSIESLGLTVHIFSSLQDAFQTIPIGILTSDTIGYRTRHGRMGMPQMMRHWKILSTMHFLSALQGYSQIYGWGSLDHVFETQKPQQIWARMNVSYQCKVDSIIMVADRYMNGRNRLQGKPHPPPPIHFNEHHLAWLQSGHASDRLMLLPHLDAADT